MIQINKKFLIISMSVGIALAGCKKDFLDVNKDPNRVTDDNVTAELIFPSAAEASGALSFAGSRADGAGAKTTMQFAQDWVGYMAANGDFARDNTETSYNIDFTFADNLFQTRYGILFDLHQTEIKALANDDTALAAASIVLSAKMFQEMVDLFGNIPYSQAFHVDQITRPAYDDAKAIYDNLQLRLDTAVTYFGLTVSSKFAGADIINHGDVDKWIKFANTIKLRLLLRQSESSGFDPSSEIGKIFGTDKAGVLGEGESVSVNPGYVNDVDKQSPFYANYGYTPTDVKATSSTNANVYIVNILNTSGDPRIERFFLPVGAAFVGCAYGDDPGNIPLGNQSSYFGPGLVGSPGQDQWMLPSYESLFFKAEAIARGWVTGEGTAQEVYERAVTESFVWLGVDTTASAVNTYMSGNPIADWANAGATPADQAKFIVFQKYIANTGIDPAEAYADQRRLNFLPAGFISLNPQKVADKLPLRLLYPQSEYTTNSVNVLKEGTIDPFNSKLFWEP